MDTEVTTGNEDRTTFLIPHFPEKELLETIRSELAKSPEEIVLAELLKTKGFPPLSNEKVLSFILGISHQLLFTMAYAPERYYRRFQLPKRGGGTRPIATPRVFLKVVQRWILLNILYRKKLPEFVTGFVPGRGLLSNATFHVGKKYLARLDIENFFPSIGANRTSGIYEQCGFPADVVNLLTRLSLLDGALPQGSPTSPYLANLVFLPCDHEISKIAAANNLTYSRYADDLTFSGNSPIAADFISQIKTSIELHSFRLNLSKSKSVGPGQRMITVGMVVNVKAHPNRSLRRQLRAKFHQAKHHPEHFVQEARKLLGWAAYVNIYDQALGQEYLEIARKTAAHKNP